MRTNLRLRFGGIPRQELQSRPFKVAVGGRLGSGRLNPVVLGGHAARDYDSRRAKVEPNRVGLDNMMRRVRIPIQPLGVRSHGGFDKKGLQIAIVR